MRAVVQRVSQAKVEVEGKVAGEIGPGLLVLLGVAKPDTAATGALSGRWVVNADFFGSPIYFGLLLEQQGEKLTGNFDGDKLEGSVSGGRIHFLAKDQRGGTEEGNATVSGGTMTGSVAFRDSSDSHTSRNAFVHCHSGCGAAWRRSKAPRICTNYFLSAIFRGK